MQIKQQGLGPGFSASSDFTLSTAERSRPATERKGDKEMKRERDVKGIKSK